MTILSSVSKCTNRFFVPVIGLVVLTIGCSSLATAQTFVASRLNGNEPLIDSSTFSDVNAAGGSNINGASVIRVPDWIPTSERAHRNAQFYMYFANHSGDDIRLAWASSIQGDWNLWNGEGGSSPNRAWGSDGNNSGTRTGGNGVLDLDIGNGELAASDNSPVAIKSHVASPDVHVDDVNQRIVMYFHAEQVDIVRPFDTNQKSFVATSKYGLNFNPESDGGEDGQGMREVVLGRHYFRTFEVGGQTFAFSNSAELWKAPVRTDRDRVTTISNADDEGGWWNPSPGVDVKSQWWTQRSERDNPIEQLYLSLGRDVDDPRHFAVYTRTHINPDDTNIYVFYSAIGDSPESIYLTVIDTRNGSTNPGNWTALGQDLILAPELDWEGGNQRITTSSGGRANGERQLRDPYVFEDTKGTSTTADDDLFLFYSGGGEDAIGVALLSPVVNITKRNASGFALDGGRGAANDQNVYLYSHNEDNVNQKWIELARGGGHYSYQKLGTNHCIDGGKNGSRDQNVKLWTCDASNRNQHWTRTDAGRGFVQLRKRNASGFAIDGNNGGRDSQNVRLYDVNSSQNMQWRITGVH